jgi:hypothetical protein
MRKVHSQRPFERPRVTDWRAYEKQRTVSLAGDRVVSIRIEEQVSGNFTKQRPQLKDRIAKLDQDLANDISDDSDRNSQGGLK